MRLWIERLHSTPFRPLRRGGRSVYVLRSDKRLAVVNQLVEGSSIRSTERLTGVHRDTVTRLLLKTGEHCWNFLDDRMRGLRLKHIETDEIWTFVRVKQAHIKPGAADDEIGDQYL